MMLCLALGVRGQVFIGTEPTNNQVVLEVKSSNRGLLPPRINIPDTTQAYPVTSPDEGLFVANTHPGKEGLYFWNGQAWEKLKTLESVLTDMQQTGKENIFVGTANYSTPIDIQRNRWNEVEMTAIKGTLVDRKKYRIPQNGVYEIMASFTGAASKANGFVVLNLYNYTTGADLSSTTKSQLSSYVNVAAKSIYCGALNAGDIIGIRIYYGSTDSKVSKVKTALLSVKKINGY
jgi:hypothetical protein